VKIMMYMMKKLKHTGGVQRGEYCSWGYVGLYSVCAS
jgi:hypothetical protein